MRKLLLLCLLLLVVKIQAQDVVKPDPQHVRWQNYGQIMFIHLSPATWQGREYDNQTTPLEKMTLSKLDTDQWCEVAKLWDAKMIILVAKHVGGFCWWQTETTDYSVKNIPWRGGKGDVVADLSKSCKKFGLDMGIYVYSGDDNWGAGIGSGGITSDPSKQEAYNKVYRQQLTEALSRYGQMSEIWFDGGCKIPVSDILEKYGSNSVVFQGMSKGALRWVGNEDGVAPDPNWYTISRKDLEKLGTALQSTPDGDVYAPVEADVPLLKNGGHKWFWAPDADHLIMTQEQLLNLYYKSVGRGSVLLLNATPDTTGLIPISHVEAYRRFGEELRRRFDNPVAHTNGKGMEVVIKFKEPTNVNHTILQEYLPEGQRVMKYVIEGQIADGSWQELYSGSSVGSKKIDKFPRVSLSAIRMKVIECKGTPVIDNFAVYNIQMTDREMKEEQQAPVVVGHWEQNSFNANQWREVKIDLSKHFTAIGQYEVSFKTIVSDYTQKSGLEFKDWSVEMYGGLTPENIQRKDESAVFVINRSQQTLDDFPTIFSVKVRSFPGLTAGDITLKRIVY